jgi:hypothetical protein
MVFSYDPSLYSMGHSINSEQSIYVPIILPVSNNIHYLHLFTCMTQGPKLIMETEILSIDSQGRGGTVLCFLFPTNSATTRFGLFR